MKSIMPNGHMSVTLCRWITRVILIKMIKCAPKRLWPMAQMWYENVYLYLQDIYKILLNKNKCICKYIIHGNMLLSTCSINQTIKQELVYPVFDDVTSTPYFSNPIFILYLLYPTDFYFIFYFIMHIFSCKNIFFS